MKARDIVNKMLDEDEGKPEDYLKSLPPKFDREQAMQEILDYTAWCMDGACGASSVYQMA